MTQEGNDPFHEIEAEAMAAARELFSEKAIDHAMNPRNVGSMEDADAVASVTGICGDTMEMWLRVENGRISRVTFWTDGCGPAIACGSMATELAMGRNVDDTIGIAALDIVQALDGMPDSHVHCAMLAAKTLKKAVLRYLNSQERTSTSPTKEA